MICARLLAAPSKCPGIPETDELEDTRNASLKPVPINGWLDSEEIEVVEVVEVVETEKGVKSDEKEVPTAPPSLLLPLAPSSDSQSVAVK